MRGLDLSAVFALLMIAAMVGLIGYAAGYYSGRVDQATAHQGDCKKPTRYFS